VLIPYLDQHKFGEKEKAFMPEDIQGDTCVVKCYGSGVRFVDDYDGDSKSLGLRCRSLPWGLMKPLNLSHGDTISTPIPVALDIIEELPRVLLQHFAVMCVYRADGTYKAVVSLYFTSSLPLLSTEDAIGLTLNAFMNGSQEKGCSVQ
jgi:hypothetical protein